MAFGKKKREAANLFETGSKGIGVLLNVHDTGMTMNDNPRIKMTFRIEPIDGSAPFEGEKTKTVSRVEIPRAGDRFPIWYDPNDLTSWAYATIDNEQGRQQIRQMFGEKAEQITGVGDPAAAAAAAAAPPDPLDRLKKLDELHTAGVLTDAEFAEKKAAVLAQI
ncbi:MAG: hypothetical protein QOE36_509 [Gaiellaceae bacterium]|jgi:hypothetical protein|nr:hypothetical protein [Gaiellaceae bacterium]